MADRSVRWRILASAVALLLLAAACGEEGGDAGSGDTDPTAATASTGDTDRDDGYAYGGGEDREDDDGAGGDDDGGESVATSVQANNFSFDPTELEIASGEDLTVKNGNANTPHTFTVDGTEVDVELAPLASEELTIDLDPGEYGFLCRFHPEMTGTLTVR